MKAPENNIFLSFIRFKFLVIDDTVFLPKLINYSQDTLLRRTDEYSASGVGDLGDAALFS
jgi:hypothetical protein